MTVYLIGQSAKLLSNHSLNTDCKITLTSHSTYSRVHGLHAIRVYKQPFVTPWRRKAVPFEILANKRCSFKVKLSLLCWFINFYSRLDPLLWFGASILLRWSVLKHLNMILLNDVLFWKLSTYHHHINIPLPSWQAIPSWSTQLLYCLSHLT